MAEVSLVLWGLFGAVAFGLRAALHARRTGSSGIRGLSGRPGSAEWLGGVGFGLAVALGVAAPILDVADVVGPIGALDSAPLQVAGIALYALGLAGVAIAQAAMGSSWRIGVDESERTTLVTGGPFDLVRNPIFTAMLAAWVGLALLVPSVVALAGVAVLLASLELHTRLVEEPYLVGAHGDAYSSYAARVGRFVPGIGKLRAHPRERA